MSNVMLGWVALALLLGIIEVFTVGFFVCFFALGALIAALASLFIPGLLGQTLVFVLSSLLMVWWARPVLTKAFKVGNRPAVESNVSALLNTVVLVLEPVDKYTGKVKVTHTGEVWTAYLANEDGETIPVGQEALIVKVDGAKLAVTPKPSPS
ncbi:NfeD family protein [Vampirovibrio chlorellavorus]|uniref:NfeD family protein n=1 Tax=Vampirovibrio chlorellavorus TaxID=758823 RepID=UPI0026EF0E47|nr:NfeD family protein [Vampirovibrio chlorellavorus]